MNSLLDGIAALLLVIGAAVLPRPTVPAAVVPWYTAFCAAAVVLTLQLEVWNDPQAPGMAYVLLVMVAYGPITLHLPAMVASAVPMLAGCILLSSHLNTGSDSDWVIASFAALLVSAVLLRMRLSAIDTLAEVTALSNSRATRDPLTGTLNRHGLAGLVPEVAALAARRGEHVSAAFVDVDGLKAANDTHGHDFGDQVLMSVATAITATIRAGDLVARWGGDEFVIFAVGEVRDIDDLEARLTSAVIATGIDTGKWAGGVSLGVASVLADRLVFDDLLTAADQDMYARRLERRSRA